MKEKDKRTTCKKQVDVGMDIRICIYIHTHTDLENLCDRQYDKH